MGVFHRPTIERLYRACVDADLCGSASRDSLFGGVPRSYRTAMPSHHASDGAAMLADLHWLNEHAACRGLDEPPFAYWLGNARLLAAGEPGAATTFEDAAHELAERVPPAPIAWRTRPDWPDVAPHSPYPLLEPCARPDQLGGRDADLDEALAKFGDQPLWAIYAPSGYGKTSLLRAGLVPRIQHAGAPVAYCPDPAAGTLGAWLVRELVETPTVRDFDAPGAFSAWVDRLAAAAEAPPVFVLDQFEEVFKTPDHTARAQIGLLIAATVDPRDDATRARCRWILSYREEFHGRVQRWLGAALRCADGVWRQRVPDAFVPRRHWAWPLPALGGTDANAAFADAVTRPLAAAPRWHIEIHDLHRLSAAFTAARAANPDAPLVPSLQVVLNRLVRTAKDGRLVVGDDATALVGQALRAHVLEVLERAFEADDDPVIARTLAALALRRLADAQGRRAPGATAEELAPTVDARVLERLAEWNTRLVVPHRRGNRTVYTLSHDGVAAVLADIGDDELFGDATGFDPRLIRLAQRVGQRAAQYADSGDDATLALSADERTAIESHTDRLLWDAPRRAWWAEVVAFEARRREAEQRRIIEETAPRFRGTDAPDSILEYLQTLLDAGTDDAFVDKLLDDKRPFDAALAAPDARSVEAARARLIRSLAPRAQTAADFGRLAAGVDVARHPDTPGRISAGAYDALRNDVHRAIRARFPGAPPPEQRWDPASGREPPDPKTDALVWVPVPGGRFQMGGEYPTEQPIHPVDVSSFDMLRHPVTRAQYAAFDLGTIKARETARPDTRLAVEQWQGAGVDLPRLPAWFIDWYEAQAYAAWLDPRARLPTEAEWEYAARGGRDSRMTRYWSGDAESDLAAVGWYKANSEGRLHAVCEKSGPPRHPLGLCDVHGNVREWAADYHTDSYPGGELRIDPAQLRRGFSRVIRGWSFLNDAINARSAYRNANAPGSRYPIIGFRVLRPAPKLGPDSAHAIRPGPNHAPATSTRQ